MTNQQLWVTLLRHFDSELKTLSEISPTISELFHVIRDESKSDNRLERLAKVEEAIGSYKKVAAELAKNREAIVQAANESCFENKNFKSISQIVLGFDKDQQQQLESKRDAVNQEIQSIRTTIASITALAFYEFEFHRRFVFELCRFDESKVTYGPDGSSSRLPQGRIYGRTC